MSNEITAIEVKDGEMPEPVRDLLFQRLEELDTEIKKLTKEYSEIVSFIK